MVFLTALAHYGKDWKNISEMIPERSIVQIRSHAQKYFDKGQVKDKLFRAEGTADIFSAYFGFLSSLKDSEDSLLYWKSQCSFLMNKLIKKEETDLVSNNIRVEQLNYITGGEIVFQGQRLLNSEDLTNK